MHGTPRAAPDAGISSFDGSRITLLSLSESGVLVYGANAPPAMTLENFAALLVGHRLSDISERTFGDLVRTVAKVGGTVREQCVLSGKDFTACYDAELWRQRDGTIGVLLVDVTGQDRDSSSVRSLSLELAHRTKNVLSIVLSLANQVARRAPDYEVFKERFFGHVDALSKAHDVIAETGWQGATVGRIVEACIDLGYPNTTVTVRPDAGRVKLKPNAVQNIAIVVRELQSACRSSDWVACDIGETGTGTLDLTWQCRGTHDREGLWVDMLCRHAPVSLDGQGAIDFDEDGFRYSLAVGREQRA